MSLACITLRTWRSIVEVGDSSRAGLTIFFMGAALGVLSHTTRGRLRETPAKCCAAVQDVLDEIADAAEDRRACTAASPSRRHESRLGLLSVRVWLRAPPRRGCSA